MCPSCNGWHMAQTAAHRADFVPNGDGHRPSCRRREGEAADWSQLPAHPITRAHLVTLTERVRRRVIRWFRFTHLLDAAAAADMLAWENSGFSIDAFRPQRDDLTSNGRFVASKAEALCRP